MCRNKSNDIVQIFHLKTLVMKKLTVLPNRDENTQVSCAVTTDPKESDDISESTSILQQLVHVTHKLLLHNSTTFQGARGSVVVKALCYKAEGSGFETR
jgi:flagellar biosynthesis/type III secretory pathway chaperone